MTGFGEELRAERVRQDLTLETLSARTKVNPRHFEAIEQDNLLALPGGVFRKGIVRAYIAALGLEEEPWLARYQTLWDQVAHAQALDSEQARRAEQDAWATFAANVQRGRGGRRERRSLRWLGVAALFAALAVAAWMLWRALHPDVLTARPAVSALRPLRPRTAAEARQTALRHASGSG